MKLMRYNPLVPKNFFDDFFNRDLSEFFGGDFSASHPSVNVIETDANFRIEIAAPGLEREDFKVDVDNGSLNISADRRKEYSEEDEDGKFMRREFNYTSFSRRFQLPESVKADDIEANYENGVLKITLPKKDEAKVKAAKTIEIK